MPTPVTSAPGAPRCSDNAAVARRAAAASRRCDRGHSKTLPSPSCARSARAGCRPTAESAVVCDAVREARYGAAVASTRATPILVQKDTFPHRYRVTSLPRLRFTPLRGSWPPSLTPPVGAARSCGLREAPRLGTSRPYGGADFCFPGFPEGSPSGKAVRPAEERRVVRTSRTSRTERRPNQRSRT